VFAKRSRHFDQQFAGPLLVTALAHTLGVIVLLVTPAGVLWRLYARVHGPGPVDADYVIRLLAGFVAGLAAGGTLLAAGALLRYASAILRALHRSEQAQARPQAGEGESLAPQPTAHPPKGTKYTDVVGMTAGRPTTLAEVLATLEELRDIALLSDEQRGRMGERLSALQRERLRARVNEALDDRRLRDAREYLAGAVARFGPSAEFDHLGQKIESVAEATEPLAHARAVRRIEKAISEGAWSAAEQLAKALAVEYPGSQPCRQLLEATQRGRRYTVVQQFTTQHRWSEALAAAEEFLKVYPESLEARTLGVEIQTLRQNAEIQRRKQYEALIKEHLRSQRFADALRLARHVIETFPESPQARALRKQIPVLERRVSPPQA